ncbi:acyl-CoA dehydrogenase [Rhizobium sp. CRIBSB]|nr:acyl-CoA dehydrogenase [Rhizobium sp. CRIBSB]
MDFNHSDLQRMLLEGAERFIGDHFTLEHRRGLRAGDTGLDESAWATFAELGWLALGIPEELGGLGGTQADIAVLAAAFGGRCVSQPFVSTAVLGTHILSGAVPPRTEVLESIIGGSARLALAHREPGERYPGSSPRAVTATPSDQGLVLSGQKMMALDAPSATHLIVSASMPDGGLALLLVEAGAAGVHSEAYPLVDNSRAADIRFDDVRLTDDAVLAKGPAADVLLAEAVDRASLARLAQAVGSMEEVLRICSAYLKERQQFGQPIGRFQALQHIMADMFVVTHQSRSALYQAVAHMDAVQEVRRRALSLAAITIHEAGQLVSRQGVQLHGGYGVTDEYEISHHYRHLLVLEKADGDLDFHLRRVTRG